MKLGLLYESGNIDELEEKMRYLFDDSKLAEKMGIAAKEFAKKEFSKERYYNEIYNIYKKLVGEKK